MASPQPRPRRPHVDPVRVPAQPEGGSRHGAPRGSLVTVSRGPSLVSINHGSTFMVAAPDGSIGQDRSGAQGQGLYADDTRFLSGHALRLNDRPLRVVASSRLSFRHARWTLMAPELSNVAGTINDVHVTVTLDRLVSDRRLHEDVTVEAFGSGVAQGLTLQVDLGSDFADLFEVRTQRWQRRVGLSTTWHGGRLESRYDREDFVRRCLVRVASEHQVDYANGELHFPVDVAPGRPVRICLQYDLLTSAAARPALVGCPLQNTAVDRAERLRRRWHRTVARAGAKDLRLLQAYDQALEDFAALRLYDHDFSQDVWVPAAGIPWFVAVFGRDSIIASMQAMPVHPLFAIGTLQKLGAWQSDVDDPVRDAEPGKICHEMRVGEWARFHTVPHSPYYGTADATPLYLMLLAETYRWMGDSELLHRFRSTAERCLQWIDEHGDQDGDGFQEYAPRTPTGYRNHCWRDAEDGVLDEQGGFPPHPLGTCEMQAYVVAAKAGVADLFDAWGDRERATALRRQAEELRRRLVERWWLEDEGTLAFALDGEKRLVRTATSNPGHCLWLGMLDRERGRRAADRLMRPDLFSGWGLRTLSSAHPAYDPHSYQRGSVWPHDTMFAAAGLRRYGRVEDFWRVLDGQLAAVRAFERVQLPELYAGLPRRAPDTPVPYELANVPQAWAAGTVFFAVRLLLGLEPDVPGGCVYVDPLLPPWCPELSLENVRVGGQRLSVQAWRRQDGSSDVRVQTTGGPLRVVHGRPPWLALPGA